MRGLALLVCAAAALPALEGRPFVDLRLTFGGAADLDTIEDDAGTTTFDDRIGIQGAAHCVVRQRIHGRFGYAVGAGLFYVAHAAEDPNDGDVTYSYHALGIEASAGAMWQIVHGVHAEVRPYVRVGRGALIVVNDGSGAPDDEDGEGGRYRAFGALLGGYYTFPFGLQLGGEAGWEDFSGESRLDAGELTAEGSSGFLRITAGYVF